MDLGSVIVWVSGTCSIFKHWTHKRFDTLRFYLSRTSPEVALQKDVIATNAKKQKVETHTFQWEWENDGGAWVRYSPAQSQQLVDHSFKDAQLEMGTGDTVVLVNFTKMIQKNKKTGWARRVRCCVLDQGHSECHAWSWRNTKNKTNYFSAENCGTLETERHAGNVSVNIDVDGKPCVINLLNMEHRQGAAKTWGKVEREKSDATEPAKSESLDSGVASTSSETLPSQGSDESGSVKVKTEVKVEHDVETKVRGKSGSKAKSTGAAKSSRATESRGKSGVARVVVVNGQAPVDAECSSISDRAHVYCEGDDVWDCMLNQTNVSSNNNKYYIVQLLEEHKKPSYHVWQRWGRVGYKGMNNLVTCGPDLNKAKSVFTKKFLDKTKNEWENRKFFEKVAGKYDMLAMDYSTKGRDETDDPAGNKEPVKYPDCSLNTRLQVLLKLICDMKYMEQAVIEMEYDANKAPLGKLTAAQIKDGYRALKKIADLIEKEDYGKKLTQACSDFYTRIPHNFGMRPPTTIRTEEEVKIKLQLLETLDDIEIAVKTLREGDHSENPIDRHYKALDCELEPMDKAHVDYKVIERYLRDTHASTHTQYNIDIVDVFRCDKSQERDRFRDCGNRILLWHGSRLTNWVGILSKGLRIAPPEAPVTGYMFGKGLYFADMSSKSANYCFATPSKNVGILLLCDVATGSQHELLAANSDAHQLPPNTHSVKGVGRIAPDSSQHARLSDGVLVPCGKGVSTGVNNTKGYTLNYNEYIVYNTNQVRMRYLLQVKFNFKK